MQNYQEGVNVDRLVSFCALVAFMRIQESNRGFAKRTILDDQAKKLQKSDNLFKLNSSPFRNIGNKRTKIGGKSYKRSPFKHFK